MATSAKNFAISPAAYDLGMGQGDLLREQLSDEEQARRRQLAMARNPLLGMGGSVQGLASLDLFGSGGSLGR